MAEKTFQKCRSCGGDVEFAPGSGHITCQFCGAENELRPSLPSVQEELDYYANLDKFISREGASKTETVRTVHCSGCGAEFTLPSDTTTGDCDFCGTQMVSDTEPHKAMLPQYLLPFRITKTQAGDTFRKWLASRRLAPGKLKQFSKISEPLRGIYYPFWTYDADTSTSYTGERGIDRQETYQTTDKEGKTVEATRTVTDWFPVRGHVARNFDDLLIPANGSLPEKLLDKLGGWDLKELAEYDTRFFAGFKAETYTIDVQEGLQKARAKMDAQIREDIKRDIGGNHQRIHSVDTDVTGIKFKYIQLPIWALAYKFNKKYFRVLVNGYSGTIVGDRPWSAWKIILIVLIAAAVVAGGIILYKVLSGS